MAGKEDDREIAARRFLLQPKKPLLHAGHGGVFVSNNSDLHVAVEAAGLGFERCRQVLRILGGIIETQIFVLIGGDADEQSIEHRLRRLGVGTCRRRAAVDEFDMRDFADERTRPRYEAHVNIARWQSDRHRLRHLLYC
jgi:hypothetical protein